MHITLACLIFIQAIQTLCLGQRSQGTDVADLSLSSGEHGRTVYTRDDINLCGQRTNLGNLTAVRTLVILQDHLADSLLLVLIYSFTQNL